MRDLSSPELACEERSRKSPSTLANFPKPIGVAVAHGSSVFVSQDLLPRYPSQRVSASSVCLLALLGPLERREEHLLALHQ